MRPDELGLDECRTWAAWQDADRRFANPFLSASFARIAAATHPTVRVAVITDAGRLAGLWPFSLAGRTAGPVVPRYSDIQGMVHDPAWSWEWPELLRAAGLSGMRFDHLIGDQAHGAAGTTLARSPTIAFDQGWAGYESWLLTHHKHALSENRRRQRKAGKDYTVEFVSHDDRPEALATLMRLKSAQCAHNGWVDVFAPGPARQTVEGAARCRAADLEGILSTLRFDDQIVAATLKLHAFGTRCSWFSAYEPQFSKYGPGSMLSYLCIRQMADEGGHTYSFGKGDDPYKLTLATDADMVATGHIAAGGARGVAFSAAHLPARAMEAAFARFPDLEKAARTGVRRLRQLRRPR